MKNAYDALKAWNQSRFVGTSTNCIMIRKHIKVSIVWHVWFCCGLASRDKLQIAQIARAVQLLRVNFSLTVQLHFEKKQISFIFIPLCGISWYYTAWHCSPPCYCVSSLLVWQRSSTFKTAIQYLRTASGPHVQVLKLKIFLPEQNVNCLWLKDTF